MSDVLKTLKPLLFLSKFTLFFYVHPSKQQNSIFSYFKVFLFLKLLLFLLFTHCYLKILLIFFIWPSTDINLIHNINILLSSVYITTTLITSTKNNSLFNQLLLKTSQLDKELKLPLNFNKKLSYRIYISFVVIILAHTWVITETAYNYKPTKNAALNYPWEIVVEGVIALTIENVNVAVIITMVKMIHYRFEYINNELSSISKEINDEIILGKLRWLRPLHMKVGELVDLFNNVFEVNLLAMNAMFFTQFVLNAFFLIISIERGIGNKLIIYLSIKGVYFLGYVSYMLIVCHVCHQTELEVILCFKFMEHSTSHQTTFDILRF